MDKFYVECMDLLDREFEGSSWNGPSLMATLDKLSATDAANTASWESYSAWEIANHCAQCKHIIATDLGIVSEPFRYTGSGLFLPPQTVSDSAWADDRAYYRNLHKRLLNGLRVLPENMLDKEMPTWKASFRAIIAWLCTHDAFHGAQIRSMGIPSLKEPKHQ